VASGGSGFTDGDTFDITVSDGTGITAPTFGRVTVVANGASVGANDIELASGATSLIGKDFTPTSPGSGYKGSSTPTVTLDVTGFGDPTGGTAIQTTVNFGPNQAVCTSFQLCLRTGPSCNNDCYSQRGMRCIAKTSITGKCA
jgi:hypothetical protein